MTLLCAYVHTVKEYEKLSDGASAVNYITVTCDEVATRIFKGESICHKCFKRKIEETL